MKEHIDEMTKVLVDYTKKNHIMASYVILEDYAEQLYKQGYRKQSVGEWISNELGGYKYAFYCSECGWVDGYPFNDRHKFCPNCGASMKGGAE